MAIDSSGSRLFVVLGLRTTICFLTSLVIAFQVIAQEPPRKLLVGTEYGYYPFADVDDKGAPIGFSVDLLQAVATEMNFEYEFRIGSWGEILEAIENKQLDVLPFVKHTERRDRFLDFSITHIVEHAITIKRRDGQWIDSASDLSGKEVVVMEADGTYLYLADHVPEARLSLVPTVSDALQSLAAGNHDYAVVPRTVGLVKIRNLELDELLQPTGPLIEAYARGFSFGVQEGDSETLAILNQGLNLVKESGEYERIYNKWFGIDPRKSSNTIKRRLWYGALAGISVALIIAIWFITLRRLVVRQREEVKLRREATEAAETMNRDLQKKNQELAAYDHTIAHSLKTPLAATGRFLEILAKFKADTLSEEQRHLVTRALSTLKMSEDAVDALLMLSTVSQEQIERQPLNMEALVQQALQQLQEEQACAQASVTLPATWPVVLGYIPWVGEVWLNYLSNAFKYSNVPVKVELGSAPNGADTIRFWVRSNGRPLTEEEQEKLFVPFARLHEESQGHGLGLTIVQRIIESLGGTVGVTALPGFGNEFFFTLPVARGKPY